MEKKWDTLKRLEKTWKDSL